MTDHTPADSQSDFFSQNRRLHSQQPEFNEICNALYERELDYLAHQASFDVNRLKQRLGGLSHHIRNIAYFMTANPTPLALDAYNASWFAKQSKQPPAVVKDNALDLYLTRYAAAGLVVPVLRSAMNHVHIELDSIDRVLGPEKKLHLNKHGWFSYQGESLESPLRVHSHCALLKPSKASITSACCGHQWKAKGRLDPRRLSLRELLLVTNIDWQGFKKAVTPSIRQATS